MATESMPVNGNYAPHQGFGGVDQQHNNYAYNNNASATQPSSTQPPPTSTTPAAASSNSQPADVPKDEVGWYFVEQYYTTLSRSPERLYLFYNKRSQFVSGREADKVAVCVGQRAIHERIKDLEFQDTKVRVTNVDSQASDSNIVIQVIGEISNKSQPHQKFAQTFILATQTNGYFVLNDIFRYLVDEEEEQEPEEEAGTEDAELGAAAAESGYLEPTPTAADIEPKTLTSSMDPIAAEHDAKKVDKELEDKALEEDPLTAEAEEPTVNGTPSAESEVEQAEDATAIEVVQPTPEPAPAAKEEDIKPVKPKEPEPTPAASPPKQATPQPTPAPKPAAPKTWASLAASANRVATPATPSTASSANSQQRPTPPPISKPTPPVTSAPPSAPAPTAAQAAPAAQRDHSPATASQGEEWTAVGSSHNRQQSRQGNAQQQEPQTRAYIKGVHEDIDDSDLKALLEQYGEVIYLDVNRTRGNALAEFKTPAGYNAAVSANPHDIGGVRLYVEERRHRPQSGAYGRGQFQGGRGGRGGVNQASPRGNYQSGRGNYSSPRGARGGASTPRGRGASSQAS